MCRLIVYKGVEPIQLAHLVTRPRHSITNQAFDSKLRLPSSRPMNADGFGIGWYDPLAATQAHPLDVALSDKSTSPNPNQPSRSTQASASHKGKEKSRPQSAVNNSARDQAQAEVEVNPVTEEAMNDLDVVEQQEKKKVEAVLRKREAEQVLENERPCVFKSITPAWSNANLTRLAEKVRSRLIFAHVRASTIQGAPSEDNCHPWIFDKLMWMHNGEISGFSKIKRALQQSLPEELYLFPSGYTDAEWAFMVFLSKLKDPHARSFTHVELRDAMRETVATLNGLLQAAGVTSPSFLNFVVTDGETVVAIRYISSRTSEAASLFFSSGTSFTEYQEGGLYRMTKADKRENIIMIASEPLTFERSEWLEVKTNTMLVITPKMNLLQIPIIDEYWAQPQDPAAQHRSTDFAVAMGFGHGFAAHQEVTAA